MDKEKVAAMRAGNFYFDRQGEKWTDEERIAISEMFYAGEDISHIALKYHRNESSIYQQLTYLGAFKQERNRRSSYNTSRCKCQKCIQKDSCMYSPENRVICPDDSKGGDAIV